MILLLAVVTAAGCTAERAPRQVPSAGAVATVAVERTDLSTARTMPGTLGYGVPRTIRAAGGTVTWLPRTGVIVKRGGTLYRNDDKPVTGR